MATVLSVKICPNYEYECMHLAIITDGDDGGKGRRAGLILMLEKCQ
jgi:hypothetical protein